MSIFPRFRNLAKSLWLVLVMVGPAVLATDFPLQATGHDSRIDLVWQTPPGEGANGFVVERRPGDDAPFAARNLRPHPHTVWSDFLGTNGARFTYRVIALQGTRPVATSLMASAASRAMSADELLTSVQHATFRYFWDYAHPVSGLARERTGSGDTVTTGGSGFGLMSIVVGVERGFVSRAEAAGRVRGMLAFLQDKAARHHGAWPHWLNGRTGETIPFSKFDDGGDLVETSYLAQGLLTARRYFDQATPAEEEIRRRATEMWESIEWNWYLGPQKGPRLFWHWSPTHGWKMNHTIGGHFNECLITYLLAIASPTHPIPASCYEDGWIGRPPTNYANRRAYYGIRQPVGWPMGGPLFFTHYSFLGFDPRGWRDRWCNYFENNRAIARIHRAYAVANPAQHRGYGEGVWGLTSCDGPDGYRAHDPRHDDGTVAPTAALSSLAYTPEESTAALRHFYHALGPRLWGEFGFKDAFNLDRGWFADSYLAIDQGPIVVMIENHRTALCWRLFMANEEIAPALNAMRWTREPSGRP